MLFQTGSGVKSHVTESIGLKPDTSRDQTIVDDGTSYVGTDTIKDSEGGFLIGDRHIIK